MADTAGTLSVQVGTRTSFTIDGRVWTPDPSRRVAIVGFAGTSRQLAPYKDPGIEIWSLNNAWQFVDRWDRWFELHPRSVITMDFKRDGSEQSGSARLNWLVSQPPGKPIYMQQVEPEIPASVRYPREEINAFFAHFGGEMLPEGFYANDYYTSSPAEMLALEIYEGYGESHLYRIDMLQDEEYYYQRSGCEYYTGFARGAGIKMFIHPFSALCRAGYVYGYTEPPAQAASR